MKVPEKYSGKGNATLTPIDGRINDIWVNGVGRRSPSSWLPGMKLLRIIISTYLYL
jgi:hypothetical protein